MAIVESRQYRTMVYEDDPDDYRPNSQMAVVLDPAKPDGEFVKGIAVVFERIAPGDRIPLHTHTLEEVLIIDEGSAEVTLGDERRTVGAGAVVYIPINVAHGTRNIGSGELRVHAIFPSQIITIQYLERNPAPGTEGNAPQPMATVDIREWG
jgi:quercetin dioxygenase-like cupin family protein